MKKEWFERISGGSPLAWHYRQSDYGLSQIERLAAAFLALLAESEEVATPPAVELRVGDWVRLERYEDGRDGLKWFEKDADDIGRQVPITGLTMNPDTVRVAGTVWPVSALTLIRRAGEVDKDAEIARLTAERDALQARVDGGVRVYVREHSLNCGLIVQDTPNQGAKPALLIDAQTIADHIADPGKMMDERKGERRVAVPEYVTQDGGDYSMDYASPWRTNRRKSDRRRAAGTRKDRKES